MFKKGDKIKLIRDYYKSKKGDMLTVCEFFPGFDKSGYVRFNEYMKLSITHSCEASACKLIKEITNDIDWLDAIQSNFKEGV